MVWSLVGAILSGTLPGVLIGYYFRIKYLPDPRSFKLFVGLVLLFVGFRLMKELRKGKTEIAAKNREAFRVLNMPFNFKEIRFSFLGRDLSFSFPAIFAFSLCVGVVSGIYGIGGGAIIAPFCVTFLHIPVYAVAGAVLLANFMTSLVGIGAYSLIPLSQGQTSPPDWWLGILFGVGGMTGMYFGAKFQRKMPEKVIKFILTAIIFSVSLKYLLQFF